MMKSLSYKHGPSALVLFFVTASLIISACDVYKPVADKSLDAERWTNFHQSNPPKCATCHEKQRPPSPVASPKGSFDHSYAPETDCILCHTAVAANVGVTWSGGVYDHLTQEGLAVSNCTTCHSGQMPNRPVGASNFDHATSAKEDCSSCHKDAGISWRGGTFNHSPTPASCLSCHAGQLPSSFLLLPRGAAKNFFVHDQQFGGRGDCVKCHTSVEANIGQRWAGGQYEHTSDTGAPVSATCYPCHESERPSAPSGKNGFLHSIAGTGDCALCHTRPGVQWAGATFSHSPTPATCSACHNSIRPEPTKLLPAGGSKNLYVHASQFQGMNDCIKCHASVPAYIGKSWASGLFDHKDDKGMAVATCLPCHAGEKPSGLVGNPPFNHASAATEDCASCHKNPGASWAGANFNHMPTPISCISCHSGAVPASTTLVPTNAKKNQFVHASQFNGTADCILCHISDPANIGVSWAGGRFDHKDRNGQLTSATCLPCHTVERPIGPIGTPAFDHATGGMGDCASCHTAPGVRWSGASFSHSPTPASCMECHASERPEASILVPKDAKKNLYVHSANFNGTNDCVSCHTSVAANIGNSWSGGSFNHKTASGQIITTTCMPCHSLELPIGPIGNPPFDHVNVGATDCASCHSSNPGSIGISWATGTFSHSPVPTACASCHSSDPTYLAIKSTVKNQMNHSLAGLPDCAGCHTSAAAASKWTSWQAEAVANGNYSPRTTKGVFHANVTNPNTCTTCHQGERPSGLVGSPAFDHANGGMGDCVSCHASVSTKVGLTWAGGLFGHSPVPTACASCHSSDPLYTAIQSTIKNQMNHSLSGLPDCVSCHASAAAASKWTSWQAEAVANGNYSPRTTKGVFHANMTNPSTCTTCHQGERPIGPVGTPPFDHANGGMGDCVSCHVSDSTKVGLTWAGGQFGHSPVPTACASCHSNDAAYIAIKATIKNQMNHSLSGLPDCAGCHTSAAATSKWTSWQAENIANGNYSPRTTKGVFHSNVINPNTCTTCHQGERPIGAIGTPAFDHANGGMGDCISCHASDSTKVGLTWAGGKFGHSPVPTACTSCHSSDAAYIAIKATIKNQMNHSISGLPDCAGCHTSAAASSKWTSWQAENIANGNYSPRTSKGVFHSNVTNPNTCTTCHQGERPIGAIGTPAFDHANGGMGDCISCHASDSTKVGLTWAGGKFGHSPVPTACTSCHSSDPLYTTIKSTIKNQMNHSLSGLPDCASCHATAAAASKWTSWQAEAVANGNYSPRTSKGVFHSNVTNPNTCTTCHVGERPTGSVGTPAFDHANGGMGDCVSCHASDSTKVGLTWAGGKFGHSPVPTACASCHSSDAAYIAIKATIKNQMNHTISGLPDCASCHATAAAASKWTSWQAEAVANGNSTPRTSKGVFHAKMTTPSTCSLCHAGERPIGPAGTPPFDHANGGMGDCVSCHASDSTKVGLTWVGGIGMPHPASGSTVGSTEKCADCHGPAGMATHRLSTSVANHYYQATTCIGCHSDFTMFGGNYLKYNHATPVGAGTCSECHNFKSGSYTSYTKIANFNKGSNFTLSASTSVTGSFDGERFTSTHADSKLQTCLDCHTYTQPTSSTTNVWQFKHRPTNYGQNHNRTYASGSAACTSCHEHQ